MEIWIIDDNVAFSFELKTAIKNHLSKKIGKLNFDVFHSMNDFFDQWELVQKKKKIKPSLIVTDLVVDGSYILSALTEKINTECPLLICSSASYGGYQIWCDEQQVNEFAFIEKSQLETKLPPFINKFLSDEMGSSENIKVTFKAGFELIKKLETAYYDTKEADLNKSLVFSDAEKLLHLVEKFGYQTLKKPLAYFVGIKEEKNLKTVRFKKVMRDFIMAATQFKDKYQID